MESSEIDLSEFQEENHDDGAGGGDGNDKNRDANDQVGNDAAAQQAAGNANDQVGNDATQQTANDQVGNDAAQQPAGNNGKVPLTHFTLKTSLD